MIKAKKILSVTLAAAALAATMSLGASAEPPVVVNLMPTDVNSITCDKGGGTVEMNGSSVVFKAGAEESHFTYPVTSQVDMTVSDYIYFGMESTGSWDIKWKSTALNGDINPGFSADFGPSFGKGGGEGDDAYGSLIEGGTYSPGDVEINSAGAYTWNSNLPDDGMVTMKSVEIIVAANAQFTLNSLYFGDMDSFDAVPGDDDSGDTTTEATTEATTENTTTTKEATTTTTTGAQTTTSTTAANTDDGGNTGLIVGIVVAVVVVAAVAVGVVVYMKKKKKD